MRVHSTFNNTLSVQQKAAQQAEKGAIVDGEKSPKAKEAEVKPPKESLSRGRILARIKSHKEAIIEQAKAKNAENAEAVQAKPKEQPKLTRASWDKQVEDEKPVLKPKEAEEKAQKLTGQSVGEGTKVIDKDKEAVGDVGKNKPDDPMTRSKLKQALSLGTFAFSEKERSALEDILGKEEAKR